MTISYLEKPAMRFIGFGSEIAQADCYTACPAFWDEAYHQRYARLWAGGEAETAAERTVLANRIGMYALCIDHGRSFTYVIAGRYEGGEVPEGFELYELPESEYAVFETQGPLPISLQRLTDRVWNRWYPNEGREFERNGDVSIEVYSSGDPKSPDYRSAIWLPVKRRTANFDW